MSAGGVEALAHRRHIRLRLHEAYGHGVGAVAEDVRQRGRVRFINSRQVQPRVLHERNE